MDNLLETLARHFEPWQLVEFLELDFADLFASDRVLDAVERHRTELEEETQ